MTTNATASVKSSVKNLCSVDFSLNPDGIAMAIAEEYTNTYRPGSQLNVKVIDPSDDRLFPGIDKYVNELKVCKEEITIEDVPMKLHIIRINILI